MPIFIERFLIVVCATAFYGLIINNTMGLDKHQRISLAIALIAIAYFLGHTAYKRPKTQQPAVATTLQASPPTVSQTATDSTCTNVTAGNNANVNCSPQKESKDAPPASHNP